MAASAHVHRPGALAADTLRRNAVVMPLYTLALAFIFFAGFGAVLAAAGMTDAQVAKLARVMVVVLGLVSLCLAIYSSTSLVSLLLAGYAGVTQFFPGVVLGLYWKRVSTPALRSGSRLGPQAPELCSSAKS